MNPIEQRILNKFKKEPLREISTTELVREVYPDEYSRIVVAINNEFSDKRTASQAKRRKGQLHRKTLYHLNTLVNEGILKVNSIKGKGEKYFALSIEEGELVVEKKHKQIVITKPSISTSLIEDYENRNIFHKFDPENWLSKLNCILLESTNQTGINKFYNLVYNCFSEVNDCLGLNNFEFMIQSNNPENTEEILRKMDIDTRDHERIVSIILNVKNISDSPRVLEFIKSFVRIKPKNIQIIFKAESKELKSHSELFRSISSEFSREEIKLNIHNRKTHEAPIIIGKAGPYTIREDEWKEYEEHIQGKTIGLAIANTSIAIDVHNFYKENLTSSDFRELMMRTAKTLLKVSANQRKRSNEYFKRLNELNKPYTKRFFSYLKNYIRFWNYDLKDKKQEHFLELLESSRDDIRKFCSTERTIYNSCGMPMNFDIVFSSVFKKFSKSLSTREYVKTTVRSFKDYHEPETGSFISMKERLANIFEGGDRSRFFRKGIFSPEDIVKELGFLMNTYELPLITYDFKERRGDIKLTNFLGSQVE
jgi:hypothetical protein